jgi:ATP-dependent Lhr-like helicase
VTHIERLHPAVQYHIVNSLGWPRLRPLQEQSLGPILAGHHVLLIAPTAGGKTEAAALPVLSRMLTEDWRGLSVLYICPIKALLNNLESRLSGLAGLLGRSAQLWHGDIGAGAKRQTERELPDILLTTPESLEGILIGRRDHQRLLGSVRCVVIDELHAFAGDDRGWHLLALLERVRALCTSEPQRIGLSATVGNPAALLDWVAGHCDGERTLVQITAPAADVDLTVDHVGSIENAATLISRLHGGEKRLVFCDSRSRVEELSQELRSRDVDVYVSHAALSLDTRSQAELAFTERQNCVIVATSTLELGLDVGDLDRVIQIDAPATVASFLQRLGRTGRRAGATRNTLFLATHDNGLLEALALVRLFKRGFVEPTVAPERPYHILVQQLLAMLFEHRLELDLSTFQGTLGRVPMFSCMFAESWAEVLAHLRANGYVFVDQGVITLGPTAEKLFKGKGLADLCVSFESPQTFAAMLGGKHLGDVDPTSLAGLKDCEVVLALGGRSWLIVSVDWKSQRVYVQPAKQKGKSRWMGQARGASRALAQEVRALLASDDTPRSLLTKRSQPKLDELVHDLEWTLTSTPIRGDDGSMEWWTYAGSAANAILAAQAETVGARTMSVDAYSVQLKISDAQIQAAGGWQRITAIPTSAITLAPLNLKFSQLLPPAVHAEVGLRRVLQRVGGPTI